MTYMKKLIESIAVAAAVALPACGGPECECPSTEIVGVQRSVGGDLVVTARVVGDPGCSAEVELRESGESLDRRTVEITGDPGADVLRLRGSVEDLDQARVVAGGEATYFEQTGPLFTEASATCDEHVQELGK